MMTKEMLLRETDVFLLDLDGTLYLDETPIGNVAQTLRSLRRLGKRLVFLTNNSSKTEEEYRRKLTRIGLLEEGDVVYTSGMATVSYLKKHHAGKRVYLLGTEALRNEFSAAGIVLVEDSPEVCVLAYDVELTFAKIRAFDAFLKRGAEFLATHPDDVCPTKDLPMPDVGSFLAMFERSSGRKPSVIVGKPFTPMGEELEALMGVPRRRMCMVGDRMYTDIRFAANNGMHSVLVLSGETTKQSMKLFPDVPDLVLGNVNEIFSETV